MPVSTGIYVTGMRSLGRMKGNNEIDNSDAREGRGYSGVRSNEPNPTSLRVQGILVIFQNFKISNS
jgi:hypothetical protein